MTSSDTKNYTIVEAATKVLQDADRPLTANEIYDTIIRLELFTFNTKMPISILRKQIRRHCQGVELASAPKNKLFRLEADGKYALVSRSVSK